MKSPDTASGNAVEEWDWGKGKKTVLSSVAPKAEYQWQEEVQVSPDGTQLAAIVRLEDDSFTLRVNDTQWENTFEKAWLPRFGPDGRLTAIVMNDDEWTLAVDDSPWEETFDFVWGTRFGSQGQIYTSVQSDMRYGMCAEGEPWPELFENATDFALSGDGSKSAGVVQVKSLKQADLETFSTGIYTVAVDGVAWDTSFMNVWTPIFNNLGDGRVAAQSRLNHYEYTIVVNGTPWGATYNCVWEPIFNPNTGAVTAPVRQKGRWGVAIDASMHWSSNYYQCWKLQWSQDGKNLWGIVAPEYGKFTVACDNKPWQATFPVITDLTLSPCGRRAAALASNKNSDFCVVVDGVAWKDRWDMAYAPVFSPNSEHVAALVRKGDDMTVFVDNRPVGESFSQAWAPVFSPDSTAVLLRGIQNNSLVRMVVPLSDIF